MGSELFGWNLLYHTIEKQIKKKDDVIVAFAHWYILKYGFQFIGLGESKVVTGKEEKTEVLPMEWNQGSGYHLRYLFEDKLYLLKATRTDGDIIFNFLRAHDLSISGCIFPVNDIVHNTKGTIEQLIPTYSDVISTLRRDLLDPVFKKDTHSATGTQTATSTSDSTTSRERYYTPPDIISDPLRIPSSRPHPLFDHRAVGRRDLDPFSDGGGMIFDPFAGGQIRRPNLGPPLGLPRGAVPPGARFDPINPPGAGRASGPNPDHAPLPPGYDDMFM